MSLTQTQELLEAVRKKMHGATDYRISIELAIRKQTISNYHNGTQQADAYACTKFAEVLGRDPLEVIAEVEAQAARTTAAREFWKSFRGTGRRAAVGLLSFGIALFSGVAPQAGEANAGIGTTSHNARLRRSRLAAFGRTVRAWRRNIGFWRGWYGCCGC